MGRTWAIINLRDATEWKCTVTGQPLWSGSQIHFLDGTGTQEIRFLWISERTERSMDLFLVRRCHLKDPWIFQLLQKHSFTRNLLTIEGCVEYQHN